MNLVDLIEAKIAPLYHGSQSHKIGKALEDDTLMTGMYINVHPGSGKIISLTRSLKFAMSWAKEHIYSSSYAPVVIQLNQEKLSHNYKIIPFSYFGTINKDSMGNKFGRYPTNSLLGNQYEEAITKPITNLNKYLDAIFIDGKDLEKYPEIILNHPKTKIILMKKWIKDES